MLIYEFRVLLPMTVEEYQVAQLWSVAEASKNETGGGDGIEVVSNYAYKAGSEIDDEPSPVFEADQKKFESGQYTHKIYHLQSKVPRFVRILAPKGSLEVVEKAFNAYPYCRTCITNEYMKKNFFLNIITYHKMDKGTLENVHNLTPAQVEKRQIVYIDIVNDTISSADYKDEEDPTKYHSEKSGRGPLKPDWKDDPNTPMMCAYKLVECEFKWSMLQTKVENFIMRTERRLFTNFHRLMFCTMDKWFGLTMEDIRRIEEETKKDLDELRKKGAVRGMKDE